jgi:hypothetical protein
VRSRVARWAAGRVCGEPSPCPSLRRRPRGGGWRPASSCGSRHSRAGSQSCRSGMRRGAGCLSSLPAAPRRAPGLRPRSRLRPRKPARRGGWRSQAPCWSSRRPGRWRRGSGSCSASRTVRELQAVSRGWRRVAAWPVRPSSHSEGGGGRERRRAAPCGVAVRAPGRLPGRHSVGRRPEVHGCATTRARRARRH